ncbi:hypothetical protein Y032_0037g3515 [Ancylostoma ceylanicum]|uniref:Uncharacterized protein n=1 Tax=Ancylostoma ceylanicum TaxID=53326 RepID=A0A016UKP0_9BILA|nr:hypothetical protein Y032_0037g3515 [Ancylostoma ceylanicum]
MPSISAALIEAARTKESLYESEDDDTNRSTVRPWKCSVRQIFHLFVEQFYPHHLKMFVLFVIAALHLAYTREFLTTFRAYESLANQVEYRASPMIENRGDINLVRFVMVAFVDYKKNLWMTVGAMCASLSTSAIILFFYNTYWHQMSRITRAVVCVVDMVAFMSLPFLLGARLMIAVNLTTYLEPSLRAASRLVSTNTFMNDLVCSIITRESLPLCSVVVERSIFPIIILKYLIVLCVLTAAYILLAYLIEYCIRHWFPPSDRDEVMDRNRSLVESA